MPNSNSDLEELKRLQSEASKRRVERKQSAAPPQADSADDSTPPAMSNEQDSDDEGQAYVSEKTIKDLSDQIETLAIEIEGAVAERPVLTLLAAFSLGVVIGRLLSRR